MTDDEQHIAEALILAGWIMPGEMPSLAYMHMGALYLAHLRTPYALAQAIIKGPEVSTNADPLGE